MNRRELILKGIFSGTIIGLIFITIGIFLEGGIDKYGRMILVSYLIYIIPLILIGAFIGLVSSFVKRRAKFLFWGGMTGILIGVFGLLSFAYLWTIGRALFVPTSFVFELFIKIIGQIDSAAAHGLGPLIALIHIVLWAVIGLIGGIIVSLFANKLDKKKHDKR